MTDPKDPQTSRGRAEAGKEETPPAGPHAKPELTNEEATPGAGTLPKPDDDTASDSVSS